MIKTKSVRYFTLLLLLLCVCFDECHFTRVLRSLQENFLLYLTGVKIR